jgi:hypothetical protein
VLIGASCAALGLGASAITSAGASGPPAENARAAGSRAVGAHHFRRLGLRALRRAVHGSLVVPTKTGFATLTFDRGTVRSVIGDRLTLADGTAKASYRTIVLTIPTTATVRDDGQRAALADLKPGQRALVLQGPKRTFVIAHDRRTG